MGRHRAVNGHDCLEPTIEIADTSRHGCLSSTLPGEFQPCCWYANDLHRMRQILAPYSVLIDPVTVALHARFLPDSAWRHRPTDLHLSFYRLWYRRPRHHRSCPPTRAPAVCRAPSDRARTVLRGNWDHSAEVDRMGRLEVGKEAGTLIVMVDTLLSCVVDGRRACNESVATVVLETVEGVDCLFVLLCTD